MADIHTVGVLNITPDSFSDGGKYQSATPAATHVRELFAAGASFVDVGAESTNPSSQPLTADQEISRLELIIPALLSEFDPTNFSLDTYHPETLEWALGQGMQPILNDVSGLHNEHMAALVIQHNLRVIISHLPKTAGGLPTRAHTDKPIDSGDIVKSDLLQTVAQLEQQGINPSNIILDPGIGFGKTMRLNWELLDFPAQVTDYSVMLGYSRKRFLHTSRAGIEIPETIALKQAASTSPQAHASYETWLSEQHAQIRNRITKTNADSKQTIYLRLHQISD